LFNPFDAIPIEAYSKFERKFENVLKFSKQAFIVGHWKEVVEDYSILRSAFNIFLEWGTEVVLALAGVRESARKHAKTFLMTRDSVRAISIGMSFASVSYDIEMLIVATKLDLVVRAAKLEQSDPYHYNTSSNERIEEFVLAIQTAVMSRGKLREVVNVRQKPQLSEV
jgi:hypothetical protein